MACSYSSLPWVGGGFEVIALGVPGGSVRRARLERVPRLEHEPVGGLGQPEDRIVRRRGEVARFAQIGVGADRAEQPASACRAPVARDGWRRLLESVEQRDRSEE